MDSRDRAAAVRKWYETISEEKMTATVWVDTEDGVEELITVPITYEVCPLCDGKGTHVNPSIDAHGISAEEMHEDPDFAEDYFSGRYDVACYECRGKRVVAVCKDEKVLKAIYHKQEIESQILVEMEAERRMGA